MVQLSHHQKDEEENIKAMNRDFPLAPTPLIERLERREQKLVRKGYKAVDEGKDKKADRLLGRAAKIENRLIKKKGN